MNAFAFEERQCPELPSARPPAPPMALRRRLFAALVAVTIAALATGLTLALAADGLGAIDAALIVLFTLTLPWLAIGFWNAVAGFVLLIQGPRGIARVLPLAGLDDPPRPVRARTAILMPIFNEDPDAAFRSLKTTVGSLDATGEAGLFEVFVLSDTRLPDIAAREEALFESWRVTDPRPHRLHYRRRPDNVDFKAGNLRDFCERRGGDFEFMIVLDCDSVMSGSSLFRLVRLMEDNPGLGILQTLVVGLPADSAFARVFQFGMRLGMRSYTLGSAWWQGDSGPYWGHNAIIRLRPFIHHCRLPLLPGRPPLGGPVLSHDQVEAALMRGAGYEVRVLPFEDGSWEANPPSLPAFLKRDLRWCQGNMQYLRLLAMPGLRRLGRLQLLLAILMYTAAPCWLAFISLGTIQLLTAQAFPASPAAAALVWGMEPVTVLWVVFASVLTLSLAPKLAAIAHVLVVATERRAFGGTRRILAGVASEFVFTALMAPIVGVAQTVFVAGLAVGRRVDWSAQVRSLSGLSWAEALLVLWPQMLFALGLGVPVVVFAPDMGWLAAPLLIALVGAVPFAVLTAAPAVGRRLAAWRLCAIPDDLAPAPEVLAVCRWLRRCSDDGETERSSTAGSPLPVGVERS